MRQNPQIHEAVYECMVQQTPVNSFKNVQVGKDQEKAQSEKDSHCKNRVGKKPN